MFRFLLPVLSTLACAASALGGSSGRVEKPLTFVTNPPPVQVLVPGFTVRELPLQVNNVNNLVFAPDGRLFALCYDGNVLQLKDTDKDGLEDAAIPYFNNDRNEILPSIGMCWGPGGLYIPSQGRVIRLKDTGNGKCELETVASGWPEPTGKAGSNLDGVGIAVDAQGTIYFGLGCDDWREAYRVDKRTGKSEYNIHSDRGTIQKISADWKKREGICSGLRFTVSLAFNRAGDLFCTDQEGATWLPNGNPFDELNHIQPGRHYGFPPRHPKHLPGVIDEPSVFDYGPQHQSTCGLHFNESVASGQRTFGPDWWGGDALITGESRGKIWRTKLIKTAAGYVARTDLIACLSMLTVDAVPTPQGDLLVACHSGKPDWGTGPQGKGKLFKISYSDPSAPQPVIAYAVNSGQTRVIFDRPLDASFASKLAGHIRLSMGKYVAAGDEFESFSPGYQAVKNQRTMPRFELAVTSATVQPDHRSVVLQTAIRTDALNYAITLPNPSTNAPNANGADHPNIDLLSDLTGVEAEWRDSSGKSRWTGWLPHLDLAAAKGFTLASTEHQKLFLASRKKGTLVLRAQLDVWQMLHPAVQPGSKLDYEYPPEKVTLVFRSNMRIDASSQPKTAQSNEHEIRITAESVENQWVPAEITLMCNGSSEPSLDLSWLTAEDSHPRPLPLRRILVPWAKPNLAHAIVSKTPELDGGDWERGKKIFVGDQAACSRCHQINGEGGTIGPDLSNLIYRDYASVLKDITEPSAALNPEHLAYNVELRDGSLETGVILHNNQDQLVLGQSTGKNLAIPKTNVAAMKPSAVSLMPEGLLKPLTPQQQKDLFTFLLLPAPSRVNTNRLSSVERSSR
jgi:putative heme-binding domain-containing protein